MIVAKCVLQGRIQGLFSNLWTEMAYIIHCNPVTDKLLLFFQVSVKAYSH